MQLKKEVSILTRQIDLARSEVEDLRQVLNKETLGDERWVKIQKDPDTQYPKLQVQIQSRQHLPWLLVLSSSLSLDKASVLNRCSSSFATSN
ncbi:hypothetical protein V6N11_058299 [Hibiscus sabdariffa]|uniref:Uncharacterized protein n=1 Tax=Hibiscus sabdariffa TaxID=183260 RepID=A0ABR2U3X4_9ROSI